MNREFVENALKPIAAEKVWSAETDPNHSHTPLPKTTAEMVLGHEPYNRKDRRKAVKLLRSKKY